MKQGRRRITRRVAMVCGVMLAVLFVTWLVVLGLGIPIPLDGFRNPIETAVSRALGREVHIDGALVLRPTLDPSIVAHEVRIASPAGEGDLLRAARVAVRLAPVALLRGEQHSMRLLIEDASIDLDAWGAVAHSTGPAEPGEVNAWVYPQLLSTSAELLARQPELQELVLHRVMLNYRDDNSEQRHSIKLDELSAHTRPGQALELKLRGRFLQQPYTIDLTGGLLADLLTPTGPWPLRAGVSFADTRLLLNGSLEVSQQGLEMTIKLREDLSAEFVRLAASFGLAPLAGRLSLRTDQGRPVITGELQLPALDAVLRFGAVAEPTRDTADQPALEGEVLADRPVSVPLTLSIAEVLFHGQLIVAGQGTEAGVELALSATDANAGRLLTTLTGTTGIRGRFQHVRFQASVRGSGETSFVNRVALALQVNGAKLTYGNAAGERPVDITLDELALTLPAGEAVTMSARGSLLDEPFAVEFTTAGLEALLAEESWPITLSATGGGAVLDVSGPLAVVHGNTPTRLHVGLYGQRIGDLAAWLGVPPCAASSYKLRGQLVLAENIGRLQFLQVQTDRTRLNGELNWSREDQIALLRAVLHFEELDPADVEALIPLVSYGSYEGATRSIAIDIPALPRRVEILNANIDMAMEHVLFDLVDITGVSLFARIREGVLQRSPFHTHIGNISFQGYLDPTAAENVVVFENEDDGSAAEELMKNLLGRAVSWVGGSAAVPLRWIFRKKFSAGDSADCQFQGIKAGN